MSTTTRPEFSLEPYEDKQLPEGEQLFSLESLTGHTIKAVVDCPGGQLQCQVVLVTETDCWIALDAEMAGCCIEDGVDLKVCGDHWRKDSQTLNQYLSVEDMRYANLATPSQLAALQDIEDKRKQEEKNSEAARLRKKLAELEGGAS